MPRFSIIIPVYNRGRLVCKSIDSAFGQRYSNREIIVVDDGSTDGTPEILSEYGSRIRFIKQNNQGPEVARNAAAAIAQGDYLVCLDSDDLLMPWALDVYSKAIDFFQQPKIIIARLEEFVEEADLKAELPADGLIISCVAYPDYYSKERGVRTSASAIVISREAFLSLGGFRQSCPKTFHADDLDFLLRAGTCGQTVLIESPTTVAYRLHNSNSVRNATWIVQGIKKLIANEFNGKYPGSRTRRLDRQALIGSSVIHHVCRCFSRCELSRGTRLLYYGWPMVLSAILRKLQVALKGRQAPTILGKIS